MRRLPSSTLRPATLLIAVLAVAAPPVWALGGPVMIGGDDADDHGEFVTDQCRGCGENNREDGLCLNTCFTQGCEDPARTVQVFGNGNSGGSCRQFDGDQTSCEEAWHITSGGLPAPCFFCPDGTTGECGAAGECRGCGPSNLNAGACTQTCLTCQDAAHPFLVDSCDFFDGNPTDCEGAWTVASNGAPRACGADALDCGECENEIDCVNTCFACADATRETFAGGPNTQACRQFSNDQTACEDAWHRSEDGRPTTCFFDDRGNVEGWAYIQQGLSGIGAAVTNGNTLAVCLGCNDAPDTDDSATGAFEFGFDGSTLPGAGWTRARLTDPVDIQAFFDGTGTVSIADTGLIYMPSDTDNVDGGILGGDDCEPCGANDDLPDCDTCGNDACADVSRPIFAGGQNSNACRQFDGDQTSCEEAWHIAGPGVPVPCFFCPDDGTANCQAAGECRGCGPTNLTDPICEQTCLTCEDAGRTMFAGGPGAGQAGGACRQFDGNQTDCELAWHVSGLGVPSTCFFCPDDSTGNCQAAGECRGCGPGNQGACTNTCVACADGTLSDAGASGCSAFDGDPTGCTEAFGTDFPGLPRACTRVDQIDTVNANAAGLAAFVAGGGGLFTHTQIDIPGGFGWLTTLLPGAQFATDGACEDDFLTLTPEGSAAFPILTDEVATDATPWHNQFAGDFGDLDVIMTGPCADPFPTCDDGTRTILVAGENACRQFDGDPTSCAAAWHITRSGSGHPASCFVCPDDATGNCGAADECRGCGPNNLNSGACTNTCTDFSGFCDDPTRTIPTFGNGQSGGACRQFDGDPTSCALAWHFEGGDDPASCFVCPDDSTGNCQAADECRGCGGNNESSGACSNTCVDLTEICEDPDLTFGRCSDFDGDLAGCESTFEISDGIGENCFLCTDEGGDCEFSGECEDCDDDNFTAGACTRTCGLPVGGRDAPVVIGGLNVTIASGLNHFQCYTVRRQPFDSIEGIALDDVFGLSSVEARRLTRLCAPADKNGEDPSAPTDVEHLIGFAIRQDEPRFKRVRDVQIDNQFGTIVVDIVRPDLLLVPTRKDTTGPVPPILNPETEHFKCYKVKRARARESVVVTDQFGTLDVDIKRPGTLCVPANKNGEGLQNTTDHLLCYDVRSRPRRPDFEGLLYTANQFGEEIIDATRADATKARSLCVPSTVTFANL